MVTTLIDDAEEASLSVAAVCKMAATMNETYEKMMRIPKHLYGEYYLHERAKHDARPVTMEYDEWKMQEWDETFDCLKDKQTQVVAEFLTKRPLRFSRKPNLREIGAVRLDLVKNRLPSGFVYCQDFDEMCARFRKLNSWEGDIMKLDYNRYGKYLLQNFHKMTKEERQAFFYLDVMVGLINKDIRRVKPVEEKEEEMYVEDNRYSSAKEKIISYVNRLEPMVKKEFRDNYYELWNGILELKEVKESVYDKGKQQGTTFNRNLVAQIIRQIKDNVYVTTANAVQMAECLEPGKGANHPVRQKLGEVPCKMIKKSVDEYMKTHF